MSFLTPAATQAIIALGSNLGDSRKILRAARAQLQHFSDQPLQVSSLWETSPVDCPPDSAKFLNAVAAFQPKPEETPESLLAKLLALEKTFGRQVKKIHNEPRPLDLDLIVFGREIRGTAVLVLPHPRAHLRRFVLQPLSEIAADFVLPGQSRTVTELLQALAAEEICRRLDDAWT